MYVSSSDLRAHIHGLMVHAITRGVVVAPRKKSTNTMQLSIKNSMGEIIIFTIVITITMPEGVVQKLSDRQR